MKNFDLADLGIRVASLYKRIKDLESRDYLFVVVILLLSTAINYYIIKENTNLIISENIKASKANYKAIKKIIENK